MLITKLKTIGYKVDVQILNFNGKVIGVITSSDTGKSGFVPCYPSAMKSKLPHYYIDLKISGIHTLIQSDF